MTSTTCLARVIAAGALLALPAMGQDSFTIIGNGRAEAVSADGSIVSGTDVSAGPTFWTGGGIIDLGFDGGCPDVSEFGRVAIGTGDDPLLGAGAPHMMDGFTFAWSSLGSLGLGGCPHFGTAYAISDDGDVIAGLAWNGCTAEAFQWTAGSGMLALPKSGTESARANAISGDGTVIGGWDRGMNSTNKASVWDGFTQTLILQGLPSNPEGVGEVWGISEDGTWVCGSQGFNGDDAFRWSSATGPELLGFIPSLGGAATLEAIRGDGGLCIGYQGSGGPFGGVIAATAWTERRGMHTLQEWCADRGLALPTSSLPAGNPLWFATDMTNDGSTIVGYSDNFANQAAWRIDIDTTWTGLGSGLNGITGQPLLAGAGTLVPGTTGSLTIRNASPSAPAGLFYSIGATTPVPFKGGTLEAFPFLSLIGFGTDINGEAAFPWTLWPAGVPSGTELTFQAAFLDNAAVNNISLTNAIAATVP